MKERDREKQKQKKQKQKKNKKNFEFMFSKRAIRLISQSSHWRQSTTRLWSTTKSQNLFFATIPEPGADDRGFTRTQPIDASGLHLSLDRDLPTLKVDDEAKNLAQEHLYGDPTEATGIEENLPYPPGFIEYDPAKTHLVENEDLKEENMAPDQHHDVNPRLALAHLSLALTVLGVAVGLAFLYDFEGNGQLAPRHAPIDIINRAAACDGSLVVPEKFKQGARPTHFPGESHIKPMLFAPMFEKK